MSPDPDILNLKLDETRAAAKQFMGVSDAIAALKTQFTIGAGDIAKGLPGWDGIEASSQAEQTLAQHLDNHAAWPLRVAKELLDATGKITGQDEENAAGLKLDTSGDPPSPGDKPGDKQPGGDQPPPADQAPPTDRLAPPADPHAPWMPQNLTDQGKKFLSNFKPESVPPEYRQFVVNAALKTGVPPEVLAAQIEQESNHWDPKAVAGDGYDSRGLSQALVGTWNQMPTGKEHPITSANDAKTDDPRYNPEWAINVVAEYDRYCQKVETPLYTNDPLRSMLDGYNGGPGPGGQQNAENNHYYPDVMRYMAKYQKDPAQGTPTLADPSTLTAR